MQQGPISSKIEIYIPVCPFLKLIDHYNVHIPFACQYGRCLPIRVLANTHVGFFMLKINEIQHATDLTRK